MDGEKEVEEDMAVGNKRDSAKEKEVKEKAGAKAKEDCTRLTCGVEAIATTVMQDGAIGTEVDPVGAENSGSSIASWQSQ